MLDFAGGYTTLANGGYNTDNYFIRKVEDLEGNKLYEHKNKKKLVLNSNYVYILNELLLLFAISNSLQMKKSGSPSP